MPVRSGGGLSGAASRHLIVLIKPPFDKVRMPVNPRRNPCAAGEFMCV